MCKTLAIFFLVSLLLLTSLTACSGEPVPDSTPAEDAVDRFFAGVEEPGTGTGPKQIGGLWLIDGQFWCMTNSSVAYCEDGRTIDFPTYKVCWNSGRQRFYYIRERSLFSHDPVTGQVEKLCRIDDDAHFLRGITEDYAITAEYRGERGFQVNLNTLEVREIPVDFEWLRAGKHEMFVYDIDNCLYEYSCETGESTLLYTAEDPTGRFTSACYTDDGILFVYRWGDTQRSGKLFRYARESGTVTELQLPADAVAVEWRDGMLLCAGSVWNRDNYGNLHLYRQLPEGDFEEILLPEFPPYTALVDTCCVVTDGQRFALANRGDAIIETLP